MSALEDPRWLALSKKRREQLLELHRDTNVEHDWWDSTIEDFKEHVAPLAGLDVDDVHFSGFWSQGDGAWFAGHVADWYIVLRDLGLLLKAHDYVPFHGGDWSFKSIISHRHYMSFDSDMQVDVNPYDEDEDPLRYEVWEMRNMSQAEADDIESMVCKLFEGLASELYKNLENEYDYLTSDEVIVGWMLDNLRDDELKDPEEEEDDEISFA
jgi:hypothetical protein